MLTRLSVWLHQHTMSIEYREGSNTILRFCSYFPLGRVVCHSVRPYIKKARSLTSIFLYHSALYKYMIWAKSKHPNLKQQFQDHTKWAVWDRGKKEGCYKSNVDDCVCVCFCLWHCGTQMYIPIYTFECSSPAV